MTNLPKGAYTEAMYQQSSLMKSLTHSSLFLMFLLQMTVALQTMMKQPKGAQTEATSTVPDEVFNIFFFVLGVLAV